MQIFIVPSVLEFRLVFISECPLFKKCQRRKSTGPQLYVLSDALFPRLVWNWSHNASSVTLKFQTLDNIFNRNNSDDCCSQLKGQKNPYWLISKSRRTLDRNFISRPFDFELRNVQKIMTLAKSW